MVMWEKKKYWRDGNLCRGPKAAHGGSSDQLLGGWRDHQRHERDGNFESAAAVLTWEIHL
jgi:hypothetical protein